MRAKSHRVLRERGGVGVLVREPWTASPRRSPGVRRGRWRTVGTGFVGGCPFVLLVRPAADTAAQRGVVVGQVEAAGPAGRLVVSAAYYTIDLRSVHPAVRPHGSVSRWAP